MLVVKEGMGSPVHRSSLFCSVRGYIGVVSREIIRELSLCLLMQAVPVRSLIRELRSHVPQCCA